MNDSKITPLSALLPICLIYLVGGEEVLAVLFLWIHDSVPTLFSHIHDGFNLPTGLEMKEAWQQGLLQDWIIPCMRWAIVPDALWSWDSSPSGVSWGVSFYLDLFFPLNPWCFRIWGGRRREWEMGWRKKRGKESTITESLLCTNDSARCHDTHCSFPTATLKERVWFPFYRWRN